MEDFGAAALHDCDVSDITSLVWVLARHSQGDGVGVSLETGGAAGVLAKVAAHRHGHRGLPDLSDVEVSRLAWALGYLGAACGPLTKKLGVEAAARAAQLPLQDLADVLWGLAVLGERPEGAAIILAEAAAKVAISEVNLEHEAVLARALARMAAAAGAWGPFRAETLSGEVPPKLRPIWAALMDNVGGLTGEELLMAACATLRLGIRDDAFLEALYERALQVGPLGDVAARDLMECFEEYFRLWPSAATQRRNASLALTMAHHGCHGIGATSTLGPYPQRDHRVVQLLEARQDMWRMLATG